jgi:O-antigen/teichoic acid export membrane protein
VLAVNALLARLLSPQDFGAYFLAFSLVSVGALLGTLGLNQAIVRLVAESVGLNQHARARRIVRMVFGLCGLGALGVGAAYMLLGRPIGNLLFQAPALTAVTGLVAGWMVVMTFQLLLAETFRSFSDIRLATMFGGLTTWLLFIACLVPLWLVRDRITLATAVLLAAVSGMISVALAGWLLRRKVAALPTTGMEGHIKVAEILSVGWPLLATSLTMFTMAQADLWILGAFRPQTEVAVYGAAAKLVILVAMPLQIVNAVVPPLIAEMHAQGKRRELEHLLRATATVTGIPALLALLAFVFFGKQVLGLVYGDYYSEGWTVLALLSLGQLVCVWVGSCGITLAMTGHHTIMMAFAVPFGMLIVLLGIAVVDQHGAVGVAIVTAAGLAFQQICTLLVARITTGLWTHVYIVPKRGLRRMTKRLRQ